MWELPSTPSGEVFHTNEDAQPSMGLNTVTGDEGPSGVHETDSTFKKISFMKLK